RRSPPPSVLLQPERHPRGVRRRGARLPIPPRAAEEARTRAQAEPPAAEPPSREDRGRRRGARRGGAAPRRRPRVAREAQGVAHPASDGAEVLPMSSAPTSTSAPRYVRDDESFASLIDALRRAPRYAIDT